MKNYKQDSRQQILIKVEPNVKEKLVAISKKHKRSLCSQLAVMIDKMLEEESI